MTEAASAVEPAGGGRIRGTVAVLRQRLPFTSSVVLAMLLLAVATGALWSAAEDRAAYPFVAYGLPSLEVGRWWTMFTGPFFAVIPWYYLPMVGSFALFAGFAEWQLGTRRAMAVTIGGQFVSVLVATQFLALSRNSGWLWAERMADSLDVGFSGGALAAIAVASATLRPPWALRLRAGLCVYAGVAIVYVGTLADLVHFFALLLAIPLGSKLVGGRRAPSEGPNQREWRLLTVAGLLLLTIAEVVMFLVPGDGPFGSTEGVSLSGPELAILVVLVVPMLNGLRKGSRVAWRWAVVMSAFVTLQGLAVATAVELGDVFGADYETEGLPLFFVDNLLWTVELIVLIAARHAFRVPSRRRLRRHAQGPGAALARTLLGRHGGSTLSWMTTWPRNTYFVREDGRSYLAYRKHAGVAVALGDPIAPDGTAAATVTEFTAMCENSGLVPCVFSATEATVAATRDLGWQHVQVAEDNVLDLADLEFRGKAWQDVRSALNKAAKQDIDFRLVRLADQPEPILAQVRALSEEWMADKAMPEMGFTLGGLDEAMDPATRVGLAVDAEGVVHGVTSWLPVYTGAGKVGGWTLDVMRRSAHGFRPVMEFLIASACLAFRDEGARFVSLSGAPLARSASGEPTRTVDRALESLGRVMEPYYGFRSLHAFKAKFQPRHVPLYLAFRDEADLPRIGLALSRAYLPDVRLRELAKLARKR
ncbi:bifunctional lysylphosphatidylglycerol flippase/synthetase MprF [Amycolatopsis sp. NPDC051758]|uniref:bifunctional lysylphosphatidylglycerol flippase/synthetase MprF n=1 Tax=Amycolatopsis sp. NPDC051758 TaxID=3363935 RepID=UPI00379D017A